jgi:hypothetical protein
MFGFFLQDSHDCGDGNYNKEPIVLTDQVTWYASNRIVTPPQAEMTAFLLCQIGIENRNATRSQRQHNGSPIQYEYTNYPQASDGKKVCFGYFHYGLFSATGDYVLAFHEHLVSV